MAKPLPQIEPDVLARACRGDRQAHEALYRAFAPMVYTLARRMLVSPALAEDVLQETFVEVIRGIGTWRGDGEFGLWLRVLDLAQHLDFRSDVHTDPHRHLSRRLRSASNAAASP